ncbi:hypothetical protein SAQ01S_07090 [Sphingomonas aquatilis NBRC 16722]|nr:hypothetical protein SAQ01S_07090 [Sphingomonas aquatilis NBRC 16722]
MILRVPVVATNIAEWVRRAATAINQLSAASDALETGPYADDAAAADGGIAVGALYRKPDGSTAWRVT